MAQESPAATSRPDAVGPVATRAYVSLLMAVIGRGLVSMSQVDDVVRREIAALPAGYTISMKVMPGGPSFAVEV